MTELKVGTVLYGYCGGWFGESYNPKRIEAIGADWVVVREEREKYPLFACGHIEHLKDYTDPKLQEEWSG